MHDSATCQICNISKLNFNKSLQIAFNMIKYQHGKRFKYTHNKWAKLEYARG